MSDAWKGWMNDPMPDHPFQVAVFEPDEYFDQPVLVTPIEDESLPHPGDGKEWEGRDIFKGWHPVEILGVPHEDPDGSEWIATRWPDGITDFVDLTTIREHKPEPEHKPWCKRERSKPETTDVGCWCRCPDPRSGEERRKGERRNEMKGRREWDTTRRPFHVSGDRRSGTDRRKS